MTLLNAVICGSTASMRASTDSVSSTGDSTPARICRAAAASVNSKGRMAPAFSVAL
ncbi:hypothetical protein [Mycobacterium sherrisii]|uniref:hypothetical protein n=1 Tax=Mycobacterium sherrisii TaxID=243061 RepID=UPI001FD1C2F9|nr:hypothetical protein [Mycobacterium sherrisii]